MKSVVELQNYYNDIFDKINYTGLNKKYIEVSSRHKDLNININELKTDTIQKAIDFITNNLFIEEYIWIIRLQKETYSGFKLLDLFSKNKKFILLITGYGNESIVNFNSAPTYENSDYISNIESSIFYINFLWKGDNSTHVNFYYIKYNMYCYNMIFEDCKDHYGYFLSFSGAGDFINCSFKNCSALIRPDAIPQPIKLWNCYGTIGQAYYDSSVDKTTHSIINTSDISFDKDFNIQGNNKNFYGAKNNNIIFSILYKIDEINDYIIDNFDLNNNYNSLNIKYIPFAINILLNEDILHIENSYSLKEKSIKISIKNYLKKDQDNILIIKNIQNNNKYTIKKYNKLDKEFFKDLRLFKNDSFENIYTDYNNGLYLKKDESVTRGSFVFDIPTEGHSNISAIKSNLNDNIDDVGILINFDNKGFKYLENNEWKDGLDDNSKYIPISKLNEINEENFKLLLGDKDLHQSVLKIKVILENKDVYLKNITILYSEDVLPKIKNPSITLSEIHKEDSQLSFSVEDIDGDACEYKLAIFNQLTKKTVLVENWKGLSLKYKEDNIIIPIPNKYFTTGKNVLFLEVKDEKNNIVKWNGVINRLNQFPEINIITDNFNLDVNITDAESDKITYQLEINDKVIIPYAKFINDYITPPYNFKYTFKEQDNIIPGIVNIVVVKVKDDLGEEKISTLEIIGQDNGLVVLDMDGKYYSDAYGNVKRKMELGTLYVPVETDILSFKIRNNSKYTLKDIIIKGDKSKLENEVLVNLNFSDTPFTPNGELTISQMEPNEERMVFFKISINKRVTVLNNELPIRISGTVIPN